MVAVGSIIYFEEAAARPICGSRAWRRERAAVPGRVFSAARPRQGCSRPSQELIIRTSFTASEAIERVSLGSSLRRTLEWFESS